MKKLVKGIEKNYYYFLFNDTLLETKSIVRSFSRRKLQQHFQKNNHPNTAVEDERTMRGMQFKYKRLISLENCDLHDISEKESRPTFQLETPTETMTFVVSTPEELSNWMSEIDGIISSLFEKKVQLQYLLTTPLEFPGMNIPISKEGSLFKLSRNTWKPKWMALKDDLLIYFDSKEDSQKKVIIYLSFFF